MQLIYGFRGVPFLNRETMLQCILELALFYSWERQ